jgi:hypothetical protein
VPVSNEVWPPKRFEKSTKEHQVGSRRCTACDRHYPTNHQGCLLSGRIHTETFPEKAASTFDIRTILRDGTGALSPVQEPKPVSTNADALSACDNATFGCKGKAS